MANKIIKQISRFKYIIIAIVLLILVATLSKANIQYKMDFEINPDSRSGLIYYKDPAYNQQDAARLDYTINTCNELNGNVWLDCTNSNNAFCINYPGMTSDECKSAFGCTDGPHSCDYYKTKIDSTINQVTTAPTSGVSDETSVYIYSPAKSQIAADVVLCNPTSTKVSGITSLEVTTPTEASRTGRTGFIGVPFTCENSEDVELRFELQPGECTQKTTLTSTGLSAGTYPTTVMTLDKCCIEGQTDCNAISPLNWGESYTKDITIQGAGVVCGNDIVGISSCVDAKTKKVCQNTGQYETIACKEGYSCLNGNCRPSQTGGVTESASAALKNILPAEYQQYSSWILWGLVFLVLVILFFIFTKGEKPRGY